MVTTPIIELIEQKVKTVEAHGFGEVVVKIKNGAVYRILAMTDTIVEHYDLEVKLDKRNKE